jgi:sorting and assembly machinery component 37
MSHEELTLYIWPHHWNLPSFDAECLACILYLQINFTGRYNVMECTDPDLSPTGTLPFLKHGDKIVATSKSITSYLSNIKDGDDAGLRGNGEKEERTSKAKRVAWSAYVNTHLKEILVNIISNMVREFGLTVQLLESHPLCGSRKL